MLEIPEPHRVAAIALDDRPRQGRVRDHYGIVRRIVRNQHFSHRLVFRIHGNARSRHHHHPFAGQVKVTGVGVRSRREDEIVVR
jgi:hypothetical protein